MISKQGNLKIKFKKALCVFLFIFYAPGSGQPYQHSLFVVPPFWKLLFLTKKCLLTVCWAAAQVNCFIIIRVDFKIIVLHGKCGVRSMPPQVSWMWSHFGNRNSNELRDPDEWLWTNGVWQLTEVRIYIDERMRKTNSNMFAACKY